MSRAAIFASGTPVAFETYGAVRDAHGFTSMTKTLSRWMAYCTFISPTPRTRHRLFDARRDRARRLRDIEFLQQFANALAVFRQIDRLGRRSDDRHARGLERQRQVERCLPAELHDHPDIGFGCPILKGGI